MIHTTRYNSPIGELLLAEKNGALVGVWMKDQKYFMGSLREETEESEIIPVLNQAKQWLDRYFDKKQPPINALPLSPIGSAFRKEVWNLLCEIPYGEVTTYGEISQKIAARRGLDRMSAQAVGGAVGHNPISIIIPCHRVIGSNGSLTGYAGGIEKKIRLLTLEGVPIDTLSIPTKGTAL